MDDYQKLRRKLLLGTAGGILFGPQFACAQQTKDEYTPFQRFLQDRYINADNSVFSPTSYGIDTPGVCVRSAEAIVGPYYVEDASLVRRDIREGVDGVPLELQFRIVDIDNDCKPLAGAEIDIWQCDSQGRYSHYKEMDPAVWPDGGGAAKHTDNETWLRGRQISDENGRVDFQTIYPGWYSPRAQHIHARVFLDKTTVATIQMYFPEKLNREICFMPPYNQRTPSPFTNRNDIVISGSKGADGSFLQMTKLDGGYRGTLLIGVTREPAPQPPNGRRPDGRPGNGA